jgi:hypothetical protein
MFYYFKDKHMLLEVKLEFKGHDYVFNSYEMQLYSVYSMAGRYDNPIPTRCLGPIDFLKIPALAGRYDNPIPTRFLTPIVRSTIPAQCARHFRQFFLGP